MRRAACAARPAMVRSGVHSSTSKDIFPEHCSGFDKTRTAFLGCASTRRAVRTRCFGSTCRYPPSSVLRDGSSPPRTDLRSAICGRPVSRVASDALGHSLVMRTSQVSPCHTDRSGVRRLAKASAFETDTENVFPTAACCAAASHKRRSKTRARIEVDQKVDRCSRYYAIVIDWRTTMVITWIIDFAKLLRFVREGALISRRRRPDELKRFLAS